MQFRIWTRSWKKIAIDEPDTGKLVKNLKTSLHRHAEEALEHQAEYKT